MATSCSSLFCSLQRKRHFQAPELNLQFNETPKRVPILPREGAFCSGPVPERGLLSTRAKAAWDIPEETARITVCAKGSFNQVHEVTFPASSAKDLLVILVRAKQEHAQQRPKHTLMHCFVPLPPPPLLSQPLHGLLPRYGRQEDEGCSSRLQLRATKTAHFIDPHFCAFLPFIYFSVCLPSPRSSRNARSSKTFTPVAMPAARRFPATA